MNDDELAVFAEVNAHGRSTEQKQVTVAFAYVAVVGVAAGSIDSFITGGTYSAVAAALILLILGIGVLQLTLVYRSWKVHYMIRTKALAGKDWIEGADLASPSWPSADMTLAATIALVVAIVGTIAGSNAGSVVGAKSYTQWAGAAVGLYATVCVVAGQFAYFRPWTKWRGR